MSEGAYRLWVEAWDDDLAIRLRPDLVEALDLIRSARSPSSS
jgi:hypothetical protein